ncbi:type II secretion system F family protein [Marinobacter sp. SS21]|uniref:type II secretion system F family protein n=1 Tax=Marinobacter sp. SS21 TaxID=2979460 RepID=UPI002330102E|nr:type II secretion system F family protein [Marinobacter sp. SS21]MDC0661255.1 type II secretion system F family protein [Marinobacter sp. SS21]
MSSQVWFKLSLLVSLATVMLVMIQLSWAFWRQRRAVSNRVQQRLSPQGEASPVSSARVTVGPLEKLLMRADIHLSRTQLLLLGLVTLAVLVALQVFQGLVVMLVALFFLVSAGWVYWKVRFQKQRRIIHEELPGLIDAVLRNVDAGRSLEHALISAFDDAPPVFDPLLFRLRSAVEAGREYTRLFEDFAAIYSVPSLVMVAIALRTTTRFGSSIRPVLQQVADSLRSQQEMRREFLAATAETRFTAVTFAVLPPALALYMVTINEQYSRVLLDTGTGHKMLMVAGVLQLLGMMMIWRMIQGVGRE